MLLPGGSVYEFIPVSGIWPIIRFEMLDLFVPVALGDWCQSAGDLKMS